MKQVPGTCFMHIHLVDATTPLVSLDLYVRSVKVVGSQDVLKHPA
ncbi:hypothetical protein [Xylanibacter ruminicola]|nr:hypothetical protein [Xylanibacter ruminicola]